MEIYLIRHGETVDNVAGLYAGVRDSVLTNHGHDQIQRLGEHFAKNAVHFSHIFSSPLIRTLKTAEAIRWAQQSRNGRQGSHKDVEITKVPELIEQDFGYYEGKAFHARSNAKKSGRETHSAQHRDEPGFVDVESKESLHKRADVFLEQHLLPLFGVNTSDGPQIVAIVSHGILLSHLWRRLLLRLPPNSVLVSPEVAATRGNITLEHLGSWSNTGYLELRLSRSAAAADDGDVVQSSNKDTTSERQCDTEASNSKLDEAQARPRSSLFKPNGWSANICAIDRKDHLVGLKRQRGGIGRSAHDEGQRKLEGFFKKQKTS